MQKLRWKYVVSTSCCVSLRICIPQIHLTGTPHSPYMPENREVTILWTYELISKLLSLIGSDTICAFSFMYFCFHPRNCEQRLKLMFQSVEFHLIFTYLADILNQNWRAKEIIMSCFSFFFLFFCVWIESSALDCTVSFT